MTNTSQIDFRKYISSKANTNLILKIGYQQNLIQVKEFGKLLKIIKNKQNEKNNTINWHTNL